MSGYLLFGYQLDARQYQVQITSVAPTKIPPPKARHCHHSIPSLNHPIRPTALGVSPGESSDISWDCAPCSLAGVKVKILGTSSCCMAWLGQHSVRKLLNENGQPGNQQSSSSVPTKTKALQMISLTALKNDSKPGLSHLPAQRSNALQSTAENDDRKSTLCFCRAKSCHHVQRN